jgi:hypothetical protein
MTAPASHPAATRPDDAMRRRAESVGKALQGAVGELIGQLQAQGLRDQKAMQRVLQLSQSAVSRLMSSVRNGDPLATLCSIPGQEALRQMLKGSAVRSVADADCLKRVEAAVSDFEHFLAAEAGDRSTLDAMLSDWVRESRASFELRHKAAAFKAMSALRGVQAELVFNTGILHPAAEAGRYDCIGIDGVLGCRRTRPSGVLHLFGYTLVAEGREVGIGQLDGAPASAWPDLIVPAFSTLSAGDVDTAVHGAVMQTTVRGLPLGKSVPAGADLVCAQRLQGVHRAWRASDGSPTSGVGGQAEPPTACYVVDALLHDDVWPGVTPELRLYDTVVRGVAHPDDPGRRADRLDMIESVHFLGHGLDALRMPEYPRYTELVAQACAAAGWDPQRLRGWRCTVRYPVYGAQIGLSFELPAAPAPQASASAG